MNFLNLSRGFFQRKLYKRLRMEGFPCKTVIFFKKISWTRLGDTSQDACQRHWAGRSSLFNKQLGGKKGCF